MGEAVIRPENMRNLMKRDGVPAVGVVIRPQPGANDIAIADERYRRLDLIKQDLPEDIEASVGFDTTRYVRASILESGNCSVSLPSSSPGSSSSRCLSR